MLNTKYKIRNKDGLFSCGAVQKGYKSHQDGGYSYAYYVSWNNKGGKTWNTEKALKDHLLKCLMHKIPIEDWEVIRIESTVDKPIMDWVDTNMQLKILKELK